MKTNELLRRYVDGRSEPAFEELVRQHIDLVYSSALRQLNGDVPAAQDVTQAVFTELGRHAPRLTQHPSLAGWLYTSTRYLAANARRAEQRRVSREQEAHEMNQILHSTELDTTWQELRPMLDEAMHDLSATDREAILMRYFERLPLAEVGARLGLKENAAHMRIDRAIERLRAALAKRGVTSTITALSAVLTGRAVGGAPTGLAAQVSRAAFAAAAAGSSLAWGLLKLAGLMQGKLLLAAGATALVAGLVVVPQVFTKNNNIASTVESSSVKREPATTPAASTSPAVAGQTLAGNELVLHLVDNDSGKPIPGATVAFWFRGNNAAPMSLKPPEITADNFGVCEIPFPRDTVTLLGVGSRTDGYVDTAFVWIPENGESIPRQYTLRLDTAASIGGLVVDEKGKPVAGADVAVETGGNGASENQPSPPHISTVATENALTDAEGRWRITRFSKKAVSSLNLQVIHPDFAKEVGFAYMNDPKIEQPLLDGSFVYKLDHGLSVSGIVVDTEGQPVPGAKVAAISGGRPRVTTNQADGTFTLTGCRAGAGQINAEAPGFAQVSVNVEIMSNEPALRLELKRGNILRLRVVDTNGLPVLKATVSLNFNRTELLGPAGRYGSPGQFRKQTDADGRITWESAPEGGLLFGIHANGYEWARNVPVKADGVEHLITLRAARTISGSVRNAPTGQPVSIFRIVAGEVELPPSGDTTNVNWGGSRTFRDGTFSFEDDNPGAGPKEYKFKADGCAPFITRVVGPDEGNVSFDILLYPAVTPTITVLWPDGQAATNASIGLDLPGRLVESNLKPGGFNPNAGGMDDNIFSTDEAGRFVLPADDTVTRVIAACPEGYAETTPAALAAGSALRLQPWGRLEGILLTGGKPAAGRVLALGRSGPGSAIMGRFFSVETDANGHFAFPKVPPGVITLFQKYTQRRPRGVMSEYHAFPIPPVKVKFGETTTVSLALYNVTARLSLPAGLAMETNWTLSALATADGAEVSESLKESGDGTWLAEGLSAGRYKFQASVLDSAPAGEVSKPLLQAKISFTVPGNPPGGTLDLGEIQFQPVQPENSAHSSQPP